LLPEGGCGADLSAGLKELWTSGQWREQLGAEELAKSPLLMAPDLNNQGQQQQQHQDMGVRRGLLEAVLQLSVTQVSHHACNLNFTNDSCVA
jgi:hypothetical protein